MKYCENYQNVTQRHKVRECCWKNAAIKLAQHMVAKKPSICKKMQHLQNAVKQSIIKWGMSVEQNL